MKKKSSRNKQIITDTERRLANDHQIKTYFTYYDKFWRLTKLVLIRESLNNRENFKSILHDFYGDDYFDYDSLVYQNVTDGMLMDAVSETVMYCEDYLSLLKFIRDKSFFVKHAVSYSAGIVVNIATKLQHINRDTAHKLFFIPSHQFMETSFTRSTIEVNASALDSFSDSVTGLIDLHKSVVQFYEKHRDKHNQYKHGLKLCLNGLGGKMHDEELQRRKTELTGSVFVLQNKPLQEAHKAGGVMIPDISQTAIRRNISALFDERNLLHLESIIRIDINNLINVAKSISQLMTILIKNRIELIDNSHKNQIDVWLPSKNTERLTSYSYTIVPHPDQTIPTIDDYQVKLP